MKLSVQIFISEDGKRKLEIYRDHRDFWSYEEACEKILEIPNIASELYWMTTYESGLFDSRDAAETDAKAALAWVKML